MNIWLIMLLGGILTFGIRFSLIYLFGRFAIPGAVRRGLRFVPPAVLSAIVIPELFMHGGPFDLSLGNHRLLAGLAAVAVGWKTRNTLVTILAGMAVLLVLQILF